MVYFQTKNPNLGKFWRASDWKMLIYFMAVGKFDGHFGYFMTICYILCSFGTFFRFFGIMHQEKSGNPAPEPKKMERNTFSLKGFNAGGQFTTPFYKPSTRSCNCKLCSSFCKLKTHISGYVHSPFNKTNNTLRKLFIPIINCYSSTYYTHISQSMYLCIHWFGHKKS
jgi:hypothetical protein